MSAEIADKCVFDDFPLADWGPDVGSVRTKQCIVCTAVYEIPPCSGKISYIENLAGQLKRYECLR